MVIFNNKDKIFNSKLDNKEVMIDIDLTSKRLINFKI